MFLAPDRIADTATVAEPPKPQRILWAERCLRKDDNRHGVKCVAIQNASALPLECRHEVLAAQGIPMSAVKIRPNGRWMTNTDAIRRIISNLEWAAICARYGFKQTAAWNDVQGFWCRVEKAEDSR